jgi:hypothetical protein
MKDTIFSGLTMAIVSSLAFIAYKHPTGFKRVFPTLAAIAIGAGLLAFGFEIGYSLGFGNASVSYLKLNGGSIKSPDQDSVSFWIVLAPVIFLVYLQILLHLHEILGLSPKDTAEAKPGAAVEQRSNLT